MKYPQFLVARRVLLICWLLISYYWRRFWLVWKSSCQRKPYVCYVNSMDSKSPQIIWIAWIQRYERCLSCRKDSNISSTALADVKKRWKRQLPSRYNLDTDCIHSKQAVDVTDLGTHLPKSPMHTYVGHSPRQENRQLLFWKSWIKLLQ